MSRFNTRRARVAATSPVRTTGERVRTAAGAPGYLRDARSELFLLAVSDFVGTDTYYEKAGDRDERFAELVGELAVDDPEWTAGLLGWLRAEGNMRTAALVGAAEFVKARLEAADGGQGGTGGVSNREVVASVLRRADEPGELLAYWMSRYGRQVPKPLKRGIGDAIGTLYTERALLKYDSDGAAFRFGDVLELVHPAPDSPRQGELFRHAIDRRHGRGGEIPEQLEVIRARAALMAEPVAQRRGLVASGAEGRERLAAAGMSWESLAGWLQGPMDAAAWEAVIPSMGVFALVRNLRNFDRAGVSDEVAAQVARRISDPQEVARSRMLPFRFWAAYKHTDSLRWAHALDKALNLSLANVPVLKGRSLILVDRSPSMFPGYGFSTPNSSDIPLAEQAAVFGAALAVRAQQPTLVEFGIRNKVVRVPRGGSVLRLVEAFGRHDGTDIPSAVKAHFDGHDRVVVVTDEQTRAGWLPSNAGSYGGMPPTEIDALVPADVPVYMWNMAGYVAGATPSGGGRRHTFGGLTDHAFRMIPLLESGRSADWPWR
ncbi:TROVE domain-containing protein [Streptomyces sp. NPDC049040]|uniref:TROVE domain-containing protein n=1 Tax=Streptomyces sp. NPDC049040 TaxID=3365593 RepID=UPI0037159ACD